MALITCPECGKQVSNLAPMCPNCGYPIASMNSNPSSEKVASKGNAPQLKYKYSLCKPSEYENKKNKFKYSGSATAIKVPEEVTNISDKSFKRVKAIYIGENVETVHRVEVEWFDASEDNPNFSSVDGVLFNKDKTELVRYPVLRESKEYEVPLFCKTIKKEAFYGAKKLESIILHDAINIEEFGFYKANRLKTIKWAGEKYSDNTWPPSVKMARRAFCDCSISNIVLLDGIEEVGTSFWGCPIESIVIPNTVKTLALGALENLNEITIPDSVETLGDYAFSSCKRITSVVIPDSVKTIGKGCFDGCKSLRYVRLPSEIDHIPNSCFWDCENLESIVLPKGIKIIDQYAFFGCEKLTAIELPDGLETIVDSAFSHTGIKSIVVPDTVTKYGDIFERIKNVIVSEAAVSRMDAETKRQKETEEKRNAEHDSLIQSINEGIEQLGRHIDELGKSLETGDYYVYQKNAKRLVTKRDENKSRLQSLFAVRNYVAYNNLVLDINEISKTPIYVYNECGNTVKLYNRNGVDATFAVEVNGVVYAVNPCKYDFKEIVTRAGTDASQVDKAIMAGIAGGPLLGFLATSFAQTYNTIDISCSFVHKKTGRTVKIVFGDNFRVHSSKFKPIMDKIQEFFILVARLCDTASPEEILAAEYFDLTPEEMYSTFRKMISK